MTKQQFQIKVAIDPETFLRLLPERLPGKVFDKWNDHRGLIEVLVPVYYPDGKRIRKVFSNQLKDVFLNDYVSFSCSDAPKKEKEKHDQPHLIQASAVVAISKEESDALRHEINKSLRQLLERDIERQILEATEAAKKQAVQEAWTEFNSEKKAFEKYRERISSEFAQKEKFLAEKESSLLKHEQKLSQLVEEKLAERRLELDKRENDLLSARKELDQQQKKLEQQRERLEVDKKVLIEAQADFEQKGGMAYLEYVQALRSPGDGKNLPSYLTTKKILPLDATELVGYFSKLGFQIKESIFLKVILGTLSAWSSGQFVVLSGPTGVGKTQIVSRLAEVIGAGSGVISVRPSWVEPADLLGFYNAMHKLYEPTPFVDHLLYAKEYEQLNRLYFVCLDEMNLSRVENYAADLLSKLESVSKNQNTYLDLYSLEIGHRLQEEERLSLERLDELLPEERARLHSLTRQLHTFQPRLKVPKNLAMLGTVNVDETTQMFSPKFLDRTFVVRFPPVSLGNSPHPPHLGFSFDAEIWPLPLEWLQETIRNSSQGLPELAEESWNDFLSWQDKFAQLGVHFGYRFAASFHRYMLVAQQIGIEDYVMVADYFFESKLLPRIRFNIDENIPGRPDTSKLEVLEGWQTEIMKKKKYPELGRVIEEMVKRSGVTHMIEFWD